MLSGNSIHDRAELAMRARVEDEGTASSSFKAEGLRDGPEGRLQPKDAAALTALGLDPEKDQRQGRGGGQEHQRRPGAVLRQGALQQPVTSATTSPTTSSTTSASASRTASCRPIRWAVSPACRPATRTPS